MRGRRPASAEVHEAAGVVLDHIGEAADGPADYHVIRRDRHSNSVDEVHLGDGRILVIKRARDPMNMYRFRASRLAAQLLADVPGLRTPRYVPTPDELTHEAVLVYWWVSGPTLHELWPEVAESERGRVVESWGRLMRRMQTVALPGHGPIVEAAQSDTTLERYMTRDLRERLRPAVAEKWPHGVESVDRLLEAVGALGRATDGRPPVLVHNDLFDQNVICRNDPVIECVGAIDFEDAFAGPPEAELAKTEILHGPLFGQPWEWDWLPHLVAGWGRTPDALVVSFFRAYQLVNMGFHAALTGLDHHAAAVASTAAAESRSLGSGLSHREVHQRASG